jgi:rod shape-determining protein MreD
MGMTLHARGGQQVEVYRFYPGAVPIAAFLAVVLQASLPLYVPQATLLALPMLVTLYFGLSRRNPSSGLVLGTCVGLFQDGVSRLPFGLYGIANAFVGYFASSIGARLDVEHPFARLSLAFGFYHVHQFLYAVTKRVILAQPEDFFSQRLLMASLVNAAIAVPLYLLLDRFRRN